MADPFHQFLRTNIYPFLQRLGFRLRGSTFTKACGDNLMLIGFQRSQISQHDSIVFTVTLGIISGRLNQVFEPNSSATQNGSISQCQWSTRLGQLLADPTDMWWTLDSKTDTENLAQELTKTLEDLALPNLEKYCTDTALRDLWLSGISPGLTQVQRLLYLVSLLNEIGPKSILPKVVEELRNEAEGKAVKFVVEQHIAKLGL